MMHLGNIQLGSIPRVAAPFRDDTTAETFAQAHSLGLDIAELRIDQFANPTAETAIAIARAARPLAVLATIRAKAEGGEWTAPELDRLALFQAILPEVDAIDVELSSSLLQMETLANEKMRSIVEEAHDLGKLVVGSYHNFTETPSNEVFDKVVSKADKVGADICKIAVAAESAANIRRLAAFTARLDRPRVTIAMGVFGGLSRVFFPALGSLFTFAHFGWSSAPGQLDYRATAELLARFYPNYADEKRDALARLQSA